MTVNLRYLRSNLNNGSIYTLNEKNITITFYLLSN